MFICGLNTVVYRHSANTPTCFAVEHFNSYDVSLISFRKSTPPQNRQCNFSISNTKQSVDDFEGELTFQN